MIASQQDLFVHIPSQERRERERDAARAKLPDNP
jgi:hypothetical protein